ncbi:hypothetical protein DPEC_G00192520 [Dallia pectoralis]|uniref:Uncharacterized protein n=1 Tax=Dallia pectoralis TaxID=75939 RepID=A0ACC2GC75_DALPE|nr:hypothetical protein DPEC_G00192520 [Dallia pectoralis]
MTMKFLVLVVCLIGLCSSIPVSNEQVREERSSSNERYRGFGGYNPYQQPQYPQYYPYAQQPQSGSSGPQSPLGHDSSHPVGRFSCVESTK